MNTRPGGAAHEDANELRRCAAWLRPCLAQIWARATPNGYRILRIGRNCWQLAGLIHRGVKSSRRRGEAVVERFAGGLVAGLVLRHQPFGGLHPSTRNLIVTVNHVTPVTRHPFPAATLAIRHVEDALMRANLAIVEQAQDTAEQSWTVYFDLEDSGSFVLQDGELFREEPGGTYTPVGSVRKGSTN
jgi:hypothetical protein